MTQEKPDLGERISNTFVGALLGAMFLWASYWAGGPWLLVAITPLLGYEGWALANGYSHDTISEAIWRFSERPFVPWIFGRVSQALEILQAWRIWRGVNTGSMCLEEVVANLFLLSAWFFLNGHFFFQRGKASDAARGEGAA